ncbi:uncharacterized protein LTR77_002671 [Saxophila tyrrhenica]|uniref:Heterokaryon incompatibility domain-containing protein n=1 Tax=Saxophila tyrrhenica TaxID=1690608 RepID=A0AAV9PFC1_9PEZI|nr:hypothetical protein LTR77_002671 [Saxophila tyrrhenica]
MPSSQSPRRKGLRPRPRMTSSKRPKRPRGRKNVLAYQPLGENELRLVKLSTLATSGRKFVQAFELTLQQFKLATAPPYFALSYVWGDPSKLAPICIDGIQLDVTLNLRQALVHINQVADQLCDGLARTLERGTTELYIWIDAICLNQADILEKSRQVPRMGSIYASAFTTLIWLGTVEETLGPSRASLLTTHEKVPIEGVDILQETVEADLIALCHFLKTNIHPLDVGCERIDDPPDLPSWDLFSPQHLGLVWALFAVMKSPWFDRSWVTQEFCLSQREPIALVGQHMLFMRALHILRTHCGSPEYTDYSKAERGMLGLETTVVQQMNEKFNVTYLPGQISSLDFQTASPADQLLSVLLHQSRKAAALPQDRIYSVLGLINAAKLPANLTPDYQLSHHQVFQDYTRFLISETRDLQLLSFPSPLDQPSWVFRFARDEAPVTTPEVFHSGHFTADGLGLVVDATMLARVAVFLPCPTPPDTEGKLQIIHDEYIPAAAQYFGVAPEVEWRDWIEARINYFFYDDDDNEGIMMAEEAATVQELVQVLAERSVLLTELSDVSYCILDTGEGDDAYLDDRARGEAYEASRLEVWAIKGGDARFLLEKTRETEGVYRKVGRMTGYPKLDAAYFAERKVERITLV